MISAGPAGGDVTGPRVTFAFAGGEGMLSCSLDEVGFAGCASPAAFSLPAGPHRFRVRATDPAGNTATEERAWTVACAAPEPTGAAALLHLDDAGQVLANAVADGAPATLGADDTDEEIDPEHASGRFGGGLAFSAFEGDRATWPVGLPATAALAIELWVRPEAQAGARDLLVGGDGRVAIRVTGAGGSSVRFSAKVVDSAGAQTFTASSTAVAAGAWHHVLVSLQEPALRLWVDGARAEAGDVALGDPPALGSVQLGGNYEGALDEIWISTAAIADDEAALRRYCPL
jgi:hypothetical protein